MPRVSTQEANRQIRELKDFSTNGSLRGEWRGGEYVVTSYSTAIAVVRPSEGVAYLNRARYSVTTSRHQGQTGFGVSQLADRMPLEVYELKTEREFAECLGK